MQGQPVSQERKHSLIYETVLEHIRAQLFKGALQPGDRLPTIVALAKELGIGQASVREAYRLLERMGILEVTRGRGTFVAWNVSGYENVVERLQTVEKQSLSHLIEARKLLEPSVAALAAERATPAETEAILSCADEMAELMRLGKDYVKPDVRFHELILMAAHNPVLTRLFNAINDLLLDGRRLTTRVPELSGKAVHYHRLIAMAIKERRADTARSLMYHHLNDLEADWHDFSKRQTSS